ncbi:MAG: hypothetical protein ACLP01_05445 [Solirubrobacteraceae bacterium]
MRADPELFEPMLIMAVEEAQGLGSSSHSEDPTARMRAAVRHAHDGVVHLRMGHTNRLSFAEEDELAKRTVNLAATVVRGLNDCLNRGALTGYVAININRVAQLVLDHAGEPIAEPDENSQVDPVIDGWLHAITQHAVPMRIQGELDPTDAFATLGDAGALASVLARRHHDRQNSE